MNTAKTTDIKEISIEHALEPHKIRFANPDGTKIIGEHVDRHRALVNAKYAIEATWDEALFSWYEEVFVPLVRTISPWSYRHAFGKEELGDLYLAVSDHWGYMKERDANVSAAAAARSFVSHYGTGISRHFSRFLVSEM